LNASSFCEINILGIILIAIKVRVRFREPDLFATVIDLVAGQIAAISARSNEHDQDHERQSYFHTALHGVLTGTVGNVNSIPLEYASRFARTRENQACDKDSQLDSTGVSLDALERPAR
jgi:hypothetical protein